MTGRLAWARWSIAFAAVCAVVWVVGVTLTPLDPDVDRDDQHLMAALAVHSGRLEAAALLAIVRAALVVCFFAALARSVPVDRPGGGQLRAAALLCLLTQALTSGGALFVLIAVHAAVDQADPALTALAWRGQWFTFLAGCPPTIVFIVIGLLGLDAAGLSPRWVATFGLLSALAYVLVSVTVAARGAVAPDGVVAATVPASMVIWMLAIAATTPRPAHRQRSPGHLAT